MHYVFVSDGPVLVSGQGLGQGGSGQERLKIHQENQARLAGMTQEEIMEERRKLLAQLGECVCVWERVKERAKERASDLLCVG